MFSAINRLKCIFDGPPSVQSAHYFPAKKPELFFPLTDIEAYSISLNNRASSSIVLLLAPCSPTAIVRSIWTVVIDSIYRHSIRSFSHILKKVFELSPSLAYLYSSASIIMVSLVFWVSTTITKATPNSVYRAVSHAMPNWTFKLASAVCGNPPFEIPCVDSALSSAGTTAHPENLFLKSEEWTNYCPVTKHLPGDIYNRLVPQGGFDGFNYSVIHSIIMDYVRTISVLNIPVWSDQFVAIADD